LQDDHPKYLENHKRKVSYHALQEAGYKKANDGLQMSDWFNHI